MLFLKMDFGMLDSDSDIQDMDLTFLKETKHFDTRTCTFYQQGLEIFKHRHTHLKL